MISDLQLARLCQSIYDPQPGDFQSILEIGDAHMGIAEVEGYTVICFRGTVNAADWLADLDAVPVKHATLGTLHAGFAKPMQDVFYALAPHYRSQVVITGHSLGAAHAALLAGLYRMAGIPVERLVLFACPNAGYERLAEVLEPINAVSYRNEIDPVPIVPMLPYVPPVPHTIVCTRPEGWEILDPISWHSINLYVEACVSMNVPS